MGESYQYIIFALEEQHYALAISAVEKIIRAVELISLPESPELLLGLINMGGRIIPVVNIRKRFRLPDREMEPKDRIVICQTSRATMAFVVDSVQGVVGFPKEKIHRTEEIFPEIEHFIEGVGKLDDDCVIICDTEKLFSRQVIDSIEEQD